MKSIHIGAEYTWPKEGITIVDPNNGHGAWRVYFRKGGLLHGFCWQSIVKQGGKEGYEVLSGLLVSPDGTAMYEFLCGAHHIAWGQDEATSRAYPIMFPKPYEIEQGYFIQLWGQGWPRPATPIPPYYPVEFQVTLYVEAEGFEVKDG